MPERRVILFDLGGVLVESRGRSVLRALLPQLGEHEVTERWLRSPAVDRFERGRSEPRAFAREFIAEWRLALSEEAFIESFASWVTGFFDGAEALVRALRRRHRVACLSNTNALHWARLPQLPALFDACFASHRTGLMKPEREAYAHAVRELGAAPEAVLFFDDLAPNVAAARSVGFDAHQVGGFADIVPILRAAGLHAGAGRRHGGEP
jgi:HAD superfamily hydrolase (TIGR01509 family)